MKNSFNTGIPLGPPSLGSEEAQLNAGTLVIDLGGHFSSRRTPDCHSCQQTIGDDWASFVLHW